MSTDAQRLKALMEEQWARPGLMRACSPMRWINGHDVPRFGPPPDWGGVQARTPPHPGNKRVVCTPQLPAGLPARHRAQRGEQAGCLTAALPCWSALGAVARSSRHLSGSRPSSAPAGSGRGLQAASRGEGGRTGAVTPIRAGRSTAAPWRCIARRGYANMVRCRPSGIWTICAGGGCASHRCTRRT